ncbi:hypothetical protein OC25_03240 [Pedobacter kyungheensis]|uniref:Leucine-binding protein domain-containing protein n=1 Tax=Pedobacter kyungheensis TaxID=1069985 RepID=A0A0C1DES3_9SPHI|nr:ABC transporter substrate-binding protein [Pedobacter kyungheensis]KIA96126.1 hypothetical protein OC25_03240 [Pedobacter kyungheensis]
MKVGLLLPRSTTHPLIAFSFMDGIHAFLEQHGLTGEIALITANIGFGIDELIIEQKAEELFMQHQVDLLVVYADFPVIEGLFPLVKALNKLLIVVNHGAKYPQTWEGHPNVIHHHLSSALGSWCTGEKITKEHQKAAFISSYYDGGYSLCHAISTSFSSTGEKIGFNLVGHQLKSNFDASPLVSFLAQDEEIKAFLTVLSGELVAEIHSQINKTKVNTAVTFYGSPVMVEESGALTDTVNCFDVEGFTSWFLHNPLAENEQYSAAFQSRTSRVPDSFGVLGWDTALILEAIAGVRKNGTNDPQNIIKLLSDKKLTGAKGTMQLHTGSHQYINPLYYVNITAGETQHLQTLNLDAVEASFNRMIEQKIVGISTGWLNTYLCS